jgi:hypothetical protein
MNQDNRLEKVALLTLAFVAITSLAIIAVIALRAGSVDPNASALIGVIVTGLIAFSKDIIQAIRGYSMSAQLGKVTDQLAASGPAKTEEPQPVVVTNTVEDPAHVEITEGTKP